MRSTYAIGTGSLEFLRQTTNCNRPGCYGRMSGMVLVILCSTVVPVNASPPSPTDWLDSLGAHYRQNESGQITEVDLRQTHVTDADMQKLGQLSHLESIHLAHTKISDLGLELLVPLKNVRILNLYYAEYISDLGIAHLKHWKNLQYLNLRGTKVTSTVLQHISNFKRLTFLDVGHSRVSDELFESLANLENLQHLSFGGNKMSGDCLPLLKLLPGLRTLSVSGAQRTDSGLWDVSVTDFNIGHIAQLENLELLDLGGSSISDRGVASLASLRNLHTLDLSRTRVTGVGIAALADLPKLRHLKLWQAEGIDDAAVPALLDFQSLEIIELPETGLTAYGALQLGQLKNLKQLFIGGLELTPAQVDELRSSLPGCHVSWWEKPTIEIMERSR